MTINTKGCSFMKQPEEDVYYYLKGDGRLNNLDKTSSV